MNNFRQTQAVNKEDLEGLLSSRLDAIFGFAVKRTDNRMDAEDLTQEIIIEIYRSFSTIRNASAFDSWMWKLAHNTWCRWLNRKKKGNIQLIEGMISLESIVDSTPGLEDMFIEKETLDSLRWQVGCLSKSYRDIIILHYMMDMKCEDIANVLSIPEGTVRRRLCEARTKLKEGMNDMKDFGEKSYMPGRLITNINGSMENYNPNSLFERILPQNIALAAYDGAMTIQEMSSELGVSGVYLEDEISILTDREVLRKVGRDKYQTDFVIITKKIRQRLDPIIREYGQKFVDTLYNELCEKERQIRTIGFDGCDRPWDELLWVLFPLMIFVDDANNVPDKWNPVEPPLRPGGGRWWIVGFEGTKEENPYLGGRAVTGDFGNLYIAAMYSNKYSPLKHVMSCNELEFCARFMDGGLRISEMDERTREAAAGLIARGILAKKSDRCVINMVAMDEQEYDAVRNILGDIVVKQRASIEALLGAVHNELEKSVPSHLKGQLYSPTVFSLIESVNCALDILANRGLVSLPGENEISTKGMFAFVKDPKSMK